MFELLKLHVRLELLLGHFSGAQGGEFKMTANIWQILATVHNWLRAASDPQY